MKKIFIRLTVVVFFILAIGVAGEADYQESLAKEQRAIELTEKLKNGTIEYPTNAYVSDF
jgi:hypothetical protein